LCCPFGNWGIFPNGVLFSVSCVREFGCFSERGIVPGVIRSGIGVFSRTGCCFLRCPFGNRGIFPNGVLFSASFVRELGYFPERGVVFCVVRSGIGVFSRTGCCFLRHPFGNWGVFPDGVLFSASFVRELGYFSERGVVFCVIRSGIWVFSRTGCCFRRLPFGYWGVFPDGVLFSASFVRELGCFSERKEPFWHCRGRE